ncbi:hypothetical protein P8452_52107 [Trifolium repens]|nr:hypothetical protein P8452_52107 [Trifolium repens]
MKGLRSATDGGGVTKCDRRRRGYEVDRRWRGYEWLWLQTVLQQRLSRCLPLFELNHGGEVGSECDSYGGDRRGFVEIFRR